MLALLLTRCEEILNRDIIFGLYFDVLGFLVHEVVLESVTLFHLLNRLQIMLPLILLCLFLVCLNEIVDKIVLVIVVGLIRPHHFARVFANAYRGLKGMHSFLVKLVVQLILVLDTLHRWARIENAVLLLRTVETLIIRMMRRLMSQSAHIIVNPLVFRIMALVVIAVLSLTRKSIGLFVIVLVHIIRLIVI